MTTRAERWHQVSELFDRVADLPPDERTRILDEACAADPELRSEVERLLHADGLTNPLDQDIAAEASALLLEGDPHELEGQCFGPYRIERLLGQGGMGRVYLAQRQGEDFAQTVALKLIGGFGSFDAGLARRRFLDERRILARLQHPHIARLLDGGVGPEAQPWFAMEYVDGAPLTQWCDAQQLHIPARLALFAKVCDAVDHAHRFLIVHRDLKPGNVLVDATGEPKVLDFGIAKLLDEGEHARTGSTILMTPDYAAPEQIRGGQISTATDVYALGAVLFELLTGRKPFCDPLASREPPLASKAATGAGEETGSRAAARGTTPQALRKALRGDIDRIVRTALDPNPARRYGSAAMLAQDLRAVVAGHAISLRSDTTYRMGIFLRRHRLAASTAAVAAVGLVATTGWALWQREQATRSAFNAAYQAKQAASFATVAKQESKTANSVKTLVASMLSSASPEVSLGRSLTVKQVLDQSRRALPFSLHQEPLVATELLTVMARSYMALEDYDSARELLNDANGHSSKLDSARLAMLHTARLELALATQQAEQGAASRTALRSLPKLADPALRVDALAALAAFEFSIGDETFEKTLAALEVERERLPHSDTRRVSTAAMIADLRVGSTLGRGDQSKNMALIAGTLKDAERYFPPQHPAIARLRKKLAVLYLLQDKTAESAVLLDRVLQDDRTIYGEDSTVTGQTLRFMAQVHQLLGNYALFEKYARSALAIFEGKPSADKTDLATAREYIADLALNRGKYAEARAGYQAAYEAQLADGTHSGTELFKRLKIALAHKLAGDKAAAEKLYSEVATQARAGSAAQAVAWIGQGDLARAAGDPARAADLHRKAADQLERRAMAPGAPQYRLWALQQLAADLRDMNRSQESEDILDQVVAALDKKFPYNHPYLTDAYLAQGQSILRTGGDRAEGKRLIERCLALRMQIYGAAHPDTRRARAALDAAGRRQLIADGAK